MDSHISVKTGRAPGGVWWGVSLLPKQPGGAISQHAHHGLVPLAHRCWGRQCAPLTAVQSIPSPAQTRQLPSAMSSIAQGAASNAQHAPSTFKTACNSPIATIPRASVGIAGMYPAVSHIV